jgi:hypothetical protein
MGIIDPMLIGSATAGMVQFDGGHGLWLAMMGVLGVSAVGISFAARQQIRAALPAVPRLVSQPLMASGTVGAK